MSSFTTMPSAMAGTPERSSVHKLLKRHESPTNTSTDETCSTTHCDDSSTAASQHTDAPPVVAVSVHQRSARQRLREQEAKINAMLHKPTVTVSAAEEKLQKLVDSLQADLKQNQAEKQELQAELESLQRAREQQEEQKAEEEESLAVRAARLEEEVRRKTHEATLLQDRWQSTLHRMVQYQVDLETHDLHFTDYAAQQFQAGQETLVELKELTGKDQPPANRQLGKKAKHMMSTLLKDLEVLGERYKGSRVSQEQQIADLRIAQMEWQQRAEQLEAQCRQHNIEVPEEEGENTVMSGPLMKFHQKLRIQQAAAQQTQKELQTQAQASQQQAEQAQLERDVLKKEVRRLKQTVSKLESTILQQQEALTIAQDAAQQANTNATAAAAAPKKKKGWFGKSSKSKKTPTPPPPAPKPSPLPTVDVEAALEPEQNESKRFDMLHERMQEQAKALVSLQEEYNRVARQKNQLQQTVADLRLEQEQGKAELENRVLQDLQSKLDQTEAKRTQEQKEAQATIEALRAQVAALENKSS